MSDETKVDAGKYHGPDGRAWHHHGHAARRDGQPGPARPDGVRHDDRPAQHPQRRRFYGMNTMILAMGIFYGGLAQVIAGIMEWKKNSTFGMTAFCSYGLFWLTLVGLFVFPKWMGVDGPTERWPSAGICSPGASSPASCSSRRCASTLVADRVPEPHRAVRSAGHRRVVGQRHDHQDRRLGRHLRRAVGLYGSIAQIWNEPYGHVVLPLGHRQEVTIGRPGLARAGFRGHADHCVGVPDVTSGPSPQGDGAASLSQPEAPASCVGPAGVRILPSDPISML